MIKDINVKELIPSLLTSWVAWRDNYTSDPEKPFDILKEELNTNNMPTSAKYIIKYQNDCPHCHGKRVGRHKELGLIYCICEVIDQMEKFDNKVNEKRSEVADASLKDLTFPMDMGGAYIKDMRKAVQMTKDFIKRPSNWLLFSGDVGIGKTHLLRVINKAFHPIALYITAGKLEQEIHKTRKDDTMGDLFDMMFEAPVLILDDIGMEHGGDLIRSSIEKIIDARYEMYPDNPVVLATNLDPSSIQTYIRRASDRMLDKDRTKMLGYVKRDKSYRGINPGDRS